MSLTTETKEKYIVTIVLKDQDEEGEDLNWSSYTEEYYADTREEAERLRDKFLAGEDSYYGDYVEDCYISDEKERCTYYLFQKD